MDIQNHNFTRDVISTWLTTKCFPPRVNLMSTCTALPRGALLGPAPGGGSSSARSLLVVLVERGVPPSSGASSGTSGLHVKALLSLFHKSKFETVWWCFQAGVEHSNSSLRAPPPHPRLAVIGGTWCRSARAACGARASSSPARARQRTPLTILSELASVWWSSQPRCIEVALAQQQNPGFKLKVIFSSLG